MDEIGENDVYKAERILDTKNVKGKRHFLIKWDGWDENHNTWEPEKNIIDKRLIEIFIEEKNKSSNKKLTEKRKSDRTSKEESQSNNFKLKNEENEKLKNLNQKNISKEDELRSVIRVAEGLRPLKQSKQLLVSKNSSKFSRVVCPNDSVSSDTSDINASSNSTQLINLKRLKSNNRFMRRRKLSSSIESSSSSSSIPNKRRLTINKKSDNKIKDTESESDENDNNYVSARKLKSDTSKESSNSNENSISDEKYAQNYKGETSSDESLIGNLFILDSAGDDVCVTDVTSGILTVTIKESVSPDGFFKNRHNIN